MLRWFSLLDWQKQVISFKLLTVTKKNISLYVKVQIEKKREKSQCPHICSIYINESEAALWVGGKSLILSSNTNNSNLPLQVM